MRFYLLLFFLIFFLVLITIEILCDPNLVRTAYDSCMASSRSALNALPSVHFSRNLPSLQMPQQQCRSLSDHNRYYKVWVLSYRAMLFMGLTHNLVSNISIRTSFNSFDFNMTFHSS